MSFPMTRRPMPHIRIVLLALFALLAAPAATPMLVAQEPAATPAAAPSAAPAAAPSAAPAADAAAQTGGSSLPRYTPPRTLRAYTHVFVAFAIAWVLLFGYVVFLSRKFRRVEEQVNALARS
jgi:CcmD family protein